MSETLETLLREYNGKVSLVFKQYPLDMHNWAMKAALATEAVYQMKPELFWDLHDQLFAAQKEIKLETLDGEIESFLRSNKLDVNEYKKKVASPEVKKMVALDMQDVQNVGMKGGTPSFYIDGRFLAGAQPIERFKKAIDDALASRGLAPPAGSKQ